MSHNQPNGIMKKIKLITRFTLKIYKFFDTQKAPLPDFVM